MKVGRLFNAIETHTPSMLVGFGVYSALKFILEVLGVLSPSVNPFDTFEVLSVGFLYLFEKHVPMNHLLALAPASIALSFCYDFLT